ncbi:hypothetical protein KGF54_005515 [Candida jiufengensis]|uniref:uncharacterized protein n=1 Tax=Candida jiufengensis TaxID=497108 RepID=UPI00222441CB|nr:uncharacterized protein KGF54_005515 [Candida jiufengensis]KAI5949280.1 hypothetical protein KGF54_005515 [Candida jiufengensis]
MTSSHSTLSINTNTTTNSITNSNNNNNNSNFKPNHKAKSSSISTSTNPNQSFPHQSNQHHQSNSDSISSTAVQTPTYSLNNNNSPISPLNTPINTFFNNKMQDDEDNQEKEVEEKGNYKNQTIQATLYILGWYFFSLSISLYNKWMFGSLGLNFKFPILVTSFHQLCLFLLSFVILFVNSSLRPLKNSYKGGNFFKFSKTMLFVDFKFILVNILPCSVASAGDIGLSNFAISLISLSLYTMLKTSSLIFVLIFGLIFKLEKFNWRLIIIVLVMCGSVIMMVDKPEPLKEDDSVELIEEKNSKFGIILVIFASLLSGLRWSFTQILLKKNPYTSNPISTIFYISPIMSIVLFVLGLIIEGWGPFIESNIWEKFGIFKSIILLIIPGILAFFMTLCEFKLLKIAQIITLSIAGIFKELLTIILSFLIFGDKLNFINILGLIITFSDILWYNYYRYKQNEVEGYEKLSSGESDLNDGVEYVKLNDLEINEYNRS